MSKRGRGRPPTGCPQWDPDEKVWIARILMPTWGRKPVRLPGIAEHEVARAHAKAKDVAIAFIEGGYVPEQALDTLNEWFERWGKAREAKGLASVRNDRGRYTKWVAPVIGTKPIAQVT